MIGVSQILYKPALGWRKRRINMKQPLDILEQMKNALDDAYVNGVRNASRPWQGLTDDEIWKDDAIMSANSAYGATFDTLRDIVRAVEAKLKEKNGYA